jgi:hypothetical protein
MSPGADDGSGDEIKSEKDDGGRVVRLKAKCRQAEAKKKKIRLLTIQLLLDDDCGVSQCFFRATSSELLISSFGECA